ncbi:MAG TPA: VOC family protein [Opitutaceae bacterium]|nr:VOC family protein [Opitutaceae bacterium]
MNTHNIAPVLQVADVDAALKHYKEVLGFSEEFRVGDYAGVKLGKIALHLSKHAPGEYAKPVGGSVAYVFCDEIDGYFREVKQKGATIKYPPRDMPYGMREFMLEDLDGHHLAFGCDLKKG